jgi:hypothetical protein
MTNVSVQYSCAQPRRSIDVAQDWDISIPRAQGLCSLDWAYVLDSVPFEGHAGRFSEMREDFHLHTDLGAGREEAPFQAGSKSKSKSKSRETGREWKHRARMITLQKNTEELVFRPCEPCEI